MVQERSYRRVSLRWSPAEIDRLLRAVKLEDVTPLLERFNGIASSLERTPGSARGMWLEVRDAALRGKRSASPAVVSYVRRRFPEAAEWEVDDTSLDALVAAYREAQRKANLLLDRIIMLAAADNEALSSLRQTLFGTIQAAAPSAPEPDVHAEDAAYDQSGHDRTEAEHAHWSAA